MKIQILGLGETRWPGSGSSKILDKTFYSSGNNNSNHRNGVGLRLDEKFSYSIV